MKRITIHAVLVLALFWVGAEPAAAQPTTLHVGFNGFYGAAPLYVAQDAGIFRKNGFTLELVFIAGGSVSTQALIGKSLDFPPDRRPAVPQRLCEGRAAQNHRRRHQHPALCLDRRRPHHRRGAAAR